tara:strand:- start:91 stop:408 length:318 start_codon:yes stop_codon:yes gene_type:complete
MWFYLYKLDMNKDSIFSFLKKYPMSILLAIIAINLFSIAGTLKENGKILKENGKSLMYKEACARYYAFYSSGDDEQAESREKLTASIVDLPVELVDAYCQRIVDF